MALAVVVVAMLSSRPANAQLLYDPSPTPQPGGLLNDLITGVWYDVLNQEKAERRLETVQDKLSRDAERCDSAAVERDARRISALQHRIAVDEWLIRKNSLQEPGCYPHALWLDPVSCAAIADAARPSPPPYLPQIVFARDPQALYTLHPYTTPGPNAAAPTISITILNAEPSGPGVTYAINADVYQSTGGSRQQLAVAPDATISYDGGRKARSAPVSDFAGSL